MSPKETQEWVTWEEWEKNLDEDHKNGKLGVITAIVAHVVYRLYLNEEYKVFKRGKYEGDYGFIGRRIEECLIENGVFWIKRKMIGKALRSIGFDSMMDEYFYYITSKEEMAFLVRKYNFDLTPLQMYKIDKIPQARKNYTAVTKTEVGLVSPWGDEFSLPDIVQMNGEKSTDGYSQNRMSSKIKKLSLPRTQFIEGVNFKLSKDGEGGRLHFTLETVLGTFTPLT